MDLGVLIKAALELGIVPALALFLVAAMYLQNRQLLKDRQAMETKLLNTLTQVILDNQKAMARLASNLKEIDLETEHEDPDRREG